MPEMDCRTERILWSIAIPGFGQLLNRQFFKGILFIVLEGIINTHSHLNKIIVLSFQGQITNSIATTDYQWLMFYPCVYMFAIWDAYKNAAENQGRLLYLPFVLAAYLGTVGIAYSPFFSISGHLMGPVWLPLTFSLFGVGIGIGIRALIYYRT